MSYEHLIIYTDIAHTQQAWQWVRHEPEQPLASRLYRLQKGQSGELLAQKVQALSFSIEEEAELGTAIVAARVRQALDKERVTKKFYDRFQKEHASFLTFIEGISAQADRKWYASLMLNPVIFVYFIQKMGFLVFPAYLTTTSTLFLNSFFANKCGIDQRDTIDEHELAHWQQTHQALHWFVGFYAALLLSLRSHV
jgi:hypothetical protein